MIPILPIALAAAALLFLRKPAKKAGGLPPSDLPPPPEDEGEGVSPPPPPVKPKPGKDSVFKGGGFKAPGGGGDPPPQGGGIVFEDPGGGGGGVDPEPEPDPEPGPQHGAWGQSQDAPEPIQWTQKMGAIDDNIEVQLSDQLGDSRLPNGTYYVRMAVEMTVTAPPIVSHGGGVYTWNYNQGATSYGQRETIVYRISVNGGSAVLNRVKSSQKKVGQPMSIWMFGCDTKEQCGWNGQYNSYFAPSLVWNNGLEARFKSRALTTTEGIHMYNATITLTFANNP